MTLHAKSGRVRRNSSFSSATPLGQNNIASRFLQNPEMIEMATPRPSSSAGTPQDVPAIAVVVQDETPRDEVAEEIPMLNLNGLRPNSEDGDAELGSKLSFIVKEKLHVFATNIRRRTSEVTEELEKEEKVEEESKTVTAVTAAPRKASLMALIGLQSLGTDKAKKQMSLRERILPLLINPRSYFYLAWLGLLTLALLYNAFAIPMRSSYPFQTRANLVYWLVADYVCDFLYFIDLVLVKPRLIFMRGGVPVRDLKETRQNYLSTITFKLDLASLFPLDFMYFATGPISMWRLPRLLKFSTFWELFDLLDNSFSTAVLFRVTKTYVYILFIIHVNGCIYYFISAWQGFGQIAYRMHDRWYFNKYAYSNEGNSFLRCFYVTTNVATSIGNLPAPTNVLEVIYATISWMLGVFVFALLLGQVKDIVSNAGRNRSQYRETMDAVISECHRLQVSKATIDRVLDWFNYTWQQQKTLDEKKFINKLPLKLKTDLALSVHYNTFSKVELFQDFDRALIRELVLKLRPVIFLPGDWVCMKGDVGKEMYIVNDGIIQIIGGENNEKVFAELKEGSVFGEISLLAIGGNNKRTANIRSKGYSTLFVLSKEDLNDVIADYPEAQQTLKRKAQQMLNKDAKSKKDDETVEHKTLEDICKVSTHISTPRMFDTVVKVLPKQSVTYQHLQHVLGKDEDEAVQDAMAGTPPEDEAEVVKDRETEKFGDERSRPPSVAPSSD